MSLSRFFLSADGQFAIEYREVTAQEDTDQKLTLQQTPKTPDKTRLIFPSGSQQIYGPDFEVINGNELSWAGKQIETIVAQGDNLIIEYFL